MQEYRILYGRYHDPQDVLPLGWCDCCGREIYDAQRLCGSCREEEQRMTMKALAAEYRDSAALLGMRIAELEMQQKTASGSVLDRLNRRLADLCRMYRETMQTARELEQYYG